ncbi:carbohydrate ABC transporter substrate-binding protein, CUT1 family [Sanguibacter gelidistatuariae]|uniref:Carbohydrate ABC transporter substrate-binding protein, CUT1 family n=1 Tax=Sanguibacter gelidistatuariae TaxID=1814289 RepID=A0A1G6KWT0_9MICO|nr:extracellular solute-binding protein [Sanguibacter gelidistatuariae]SDC34846.1 carbohydrate ABC transporter substrate-binding protein, CUT1 family [Sanguibacter gelidistatuariae]
MRLAKPLVALTAAISLIGLAGCGGSDDSSDSKTVKIAYQKFGNFTQADELFQGVKKEFEAANPGTTVELVPIEASQNDYFTKLALMNRSASTAPDLMYEDTFMIKSDVEAGYLAPLDDYLKDWSDWSLYLDAAKQAGKGDDGKTYGVSMGTDTRALWYNKEVFAAAGLPTEWAPKTWDDVLEAARTIKASDPSVIPFNMYSGKPMGEASVMQGFEMLEYGTGGTLYDEASSKWVVGNPDFIDSLGFVNTVFSEGLAPTAEQALDANIGNTVASDWLPNNKLGIALDGSWMGGTWMESGGTPWAKWTDVMGVAPMPTKNGDAPGSVSMSGGWTLAVGAKSKNPELAFKVLTTAMNAKNSLAFTIDNSQIAVRSDVAADPSYTAANPTIKAFTDLVAVTHFRPATSDYAQISNAIQVAMESVMTGQQTPEEAAAAYDKAVIGVVGEENTTSGS